MTVRVCVEGIGLHGPGLSGWADGRSILSGRVRYVPAAAVVPSCDLLPANERRRTVRTVRLALAVGAEALGHARRNPSTCATVFASSGGDGETINEILKTLATVEREISPTRFHNSVHNAPAGYWSIAVGSREPASSVCCHDASFAAGLLEAAAHAKVDGRAVTLITYDAPYPEPLNRVRTIRDAFGVSLVLAPQAANASLARLDVDLVQGACIPTAMADESLEVIRRGTPAARSLPLLAILARRGSGDVLLEYLPDISLRVSVSAATGLPETVDRGRALSASG